MAAGERIAGETYWKEQDVLQIILDCGRNRCARAAGRRASRLDGGRRPEPPAEGRALLGHTDRGDVAQVDLEEKPRPDDVHLGAERDTHPGWKDHQGEAGYQGGVEQGRAVPAAEP